jgi:hypothetical protein
MTTTQTPGQIFQALPAGKFATLAKISPRGALLLRKLKNGSGMFYWRSEHNGKELREPIGAFDTSAPPKSIKPTERGYSFSAAVRAAEVLSTQHLGNIDGGGYQSLKKAKKKSWLRRRKEHKSWKSKRLKSCCWPTATICKILEKFLTKRQGMCFDSTS